MKEIWRLLPDAAKEFNLLAIISYPLVAVVYVLNFARVIWADLGYGIAVGILAPLALFRWLA